MIKRFAAGVALLAAATTTLADGSAVVDLAGVQIRDGRNESRNSGADTIDAAATYSYDIDGMVVGVGGFLGSMFSSPTPLAEALETLAPGASAFLTGEICNPGGQLPVLFIDERIFNQQNIFGIDVTTAATIRMGIDVNGMAWFTLTDVTLSPSFLVGYLRFTTGQAQLDVVSCPPDFNMDCAVNTLDFLAYLNAFSAGDPAADFNGDGSINTLDFLAFLNAFNAGC